MNSLQQVSQTHRLSTVSAACESIPGAENVTQATKGVFESIKEWVVFFWTALVTWIKNTWNATTFLFFRVVGWISPEWSAKIETWCLYGVNFWQSYTAQSREAALQAEIDGLRGTRDAVENAARETAGERDQLRVENRRLRNENERFALDCTHLRETNSRLGEAQVRLTNERDAARRDLQAVQTDQELVRMQVDQIRDRIAPLEDQVQHLRTERDALRNRVALMQQPVGGQQTLGQRNQLDSILSVLGPQQRQLLVGLVSNNGAIYE